MLSRAAGRGGLGARPALLLLAAIALAGCATRDGAGRDASGGAAAIEAKENVFVPASYSAAAGASVTWKNTGVGHHTVTVQDPSGGAGQWLRDSDDLAPGATFAYAFPAGGTYDVFCRYHSQGAQGRFDASEMTMKVTVS